jgi:hypothetical protein
MMYEKNVFNGDFIVLGNYFGRSADGLYLGYL